MPWINKRETRRGERWDARVYVGGEQGSIYKTCKSEGEAKKWAREQETRKDKGDRPTADKRTLAQYLSAWLKLKGEGAVIDRHMRKNAPGPRTMDDYRRALTEWIIVPKSKELLRVGHIRIDAVTYHTLESLYASMRAFTTVRTIKKLNSLLGQAFAELEKKGILARNPADLATVPQVDAKSRDAEGEDDKDDNADSSSKAMEEIEAQAFLMSAKALADEQDRNGDNAHLIPERCWSALLHVLLGSGLRPGEALALRWTDVELENVKAATLHVRRNLVRVRGVKGYRLEKPKTKKSKRTVPLPESSAEELKRWKRRQISQHLRHADVWQDLGFVFTTSKGTPLPGARRAFRCVTARAGLGKWGEEPKREHATGPLPARKFIPAFRTYDLRHTFATLALANGVPVNVVSDWLGHENPAFTYARYGHALKKDTQAAVVTMEGVLFRAG